MLKLGENWFIINYCWFSRQCVNYLPAGRCEGDAISSIIIDGYNFIGTSHKDLNAERDKLIRGLSEYRKIKGHEITVVFDGWKSGSSKEETLRTGGIKVIYSRIGETADSVIKKIIDGNKKEWVVVTSDRDIAAFAWANGSVVVPSARFDVMLRTAGSLFAGEYEALDEDEISEMRHEKGNPRTLSRREKALMRVLRKL